MNRRYLLIIAAMVFCLAGTACSIQTTKRTVNPGDAVTPAVDADATLEGVVLSNDTQNRIITIQELGSALQTSLSYNAATVVTDKFGSERAGEDVVAGELVQTAYGSGTGRASRIQIPEDVWEYKEVTSYTFDADESSLTVAQKKYQYSGLTYFGSGGQSIEMMELNPQDVLTVRGRGYIVYSVVRTKGHGYIRLKNYDNFKGGTVSVGNNIFLPVTDNMLITVREGSYKIVVAKGADSVSKNITVRMDQEQTVDFSDYKPVHARTGTITFDIRPAGADLTINGTAVSYKRPITLSYGTYNITVSMTGYNSYSGTLDVEEPESTLHIDLVEETTSVSDTTATPKSDADGESDDTQDSEDRDTTTKTIDSDHKITVSAPEGAEIYLDNVYKGIIPCSFTKIIGSQTVTLRRDGYTTKSYSIDVLDDDEDLSLSFSELVAAASATPEASATP